MKRLAKNITIVLALAVMVSACGGSTSTPTSPSPTPAPIPEPTPPEPTPEPTPNPNPEPTSVILAGVVRNSSNTMIQDATVKILDGINAGRTVNTNTNGQYKFDGLAVGNGNVLASATGYQESTAGIYINGSNTLDFTLKPAPPELVSLTGMVRSNTGSPLSGAKVTILDGVNAGKSTTTAASGAYRFDGLTVGNGNVSAKAAGYSEAHAGVYINGSNTLDFVLNFLTADFTGSWIGSGTGTASDGTPVSVTIELEVAGGEVDTWVVRYKFIESPNRPYPGWCNQDTFASRFNIPIIGNSFERTREQSDSWIYTVTVLRGTFSSVTTVAGAVTLVRKPAFHVECPASATVQWSGTKR